MADRLRHPVQHERQRGRRQQGQRAGRGEAAPPQRRREYVPVLQRHLPHGHAHRRRDGHRGSGSASRRYAERHLSPPGGGERGRSQVRSHPPPGRHAHHLLPGDLRLARQFGAGPGAAGAESAPPAGAGPGRHSRGYRAQRTQGLRREGGRGRVPADGQGVPHRRKQIPRPDQQG